MATVRAARDDRPGSVPMPVHLIVVKGQSAGTKIPITQPQFLIGRDARCHLRPRSPVVSKWHCAIITREDGVYVRDLNSLNGTFLNSSRVTGEVRVQSGDILRVGPLAFAFEISSPLARSPQTGPREENLEESVLDWVLDSSAMGGQETPADASMATTIVRSPSSEDTATEISRPSEPPSDEEEHRSSKPRETGRSTADVANELLERLFDPRRRR